MKISVFSFKPFEQEYLEKSNTLNHHFYYYQERLTEDTIELANNCEAIAVFTNDDLNKNILYQLHQKGIKYISTRSAGTDNIDKEEARNLNIKIANVPGYSPSAIAEHVFALLLTLARNILQSQEKMNNNNFDLTGLVGFELNNKTIGIVGTGRIGYQTAKIAAGFGMNILAYDIEENHQYKEELGLIYTDLDTLFKSCDIISLHAPYNEMTAYMIDEYALKEMKNGVIIVNTARGGLIKTTALIEALESGKVGAAALDVYEKERGLYFHDYSNKTINDTNFLKLKSFSNVILTGHQAFLTNTALKNIAETTLYNFNCWEKGESSENEIE